MKIGLVGTLAAIRFETKNGAKVGIADIVIHGDYVFPTKVPQVRIPNTTLSEILIKAKQEVESPIVSMICWVEATSKDNLETTCIAIVSVSSKQSEELPVGG